MLVFLMCLFLYLMLGLINCGLILRFMPSELRNGEPKIPMIFFLLGWPIILIITVGVFIHNLAKRFVLFIGDKEDFD